jgi:hypothetical protein
MGTTMLFQVPDSLFNIVQLPKYMERDQMLPFRASGIFRKNLAEALGLTVRCETTPSLASPDREDDRAREDEWFTAVGRTRLFQGCAEAVAALSEHAN